jgi:hypothetical protein
MIKKQQKWIVLLVTLTFVWLLQVSAMPVAAASATDQIRSSNSEKAPSFIEQEGASGYAAKKKNIFPIILVGVGVAAVAAVLFLVVLKTKYDITGTWTVSYHWTGSSSGTYTITFAGSKKSGTWLATESGTTHNGTYTVDGKNVVFGIPGGTTYTGTFTDKESMSGTSVLSGGTLTGTWTATKTSSAAAISVPMTLSGNGVNGFTGKLR